MTKTNSRDIIIYNLSFSDFLPCSKKEFAMNKKSLFGILIVALTLAACSFNEKSSGSGELSFSVPKSTVAQIFEKSMGLSASADYTPPPYSCTNCGRFFI